MKNIDKAEQIRNLRDQIEEKVQEIRDIAREVLGRNRMGGFDAYVFNALNAHINKCNPFDQDLSDVADAIENEPDADDPDEGDLDEDEET